MALENAVSRKMMQQTSDNLDPGTSGLSGMLPSSDRVSSFAPSGFAEAAAAFDPSSKREERQGAMTPTMIPATATGGFGLAACTLTDRMSHSREADLLTEDALSLLLGFTNLVEEGRTAARGLLKQFGSLGAVLAASPKSLRNLLGQCPEAIALLRGVHQTMVLALRETVAERPLLKNTNALKDYLHISLAHEEREMVRLLFLDARNALILDEMHSQGSVSNAPVYPREIVRRLIETNATALIIVHNHPSGDPTPSSDDVEMTQRIASVLAGIGVKLQDSVVIGRRGYTSLRSRGLL